jgi:undecaprenyl diphosphate synthase
VDRPNFLPHLVFHLLFHRTFPPADRVPARHGPRCSGQGDRFDLVARSDQQASAADGLDGAPAVAPVPEELDRSRVPVHVACVMDGNGRWARSRDLPRTEGHAAGEVALLDVVNGALEIGVRWLTMYAFSTENWRRPPDEVRYLMGFNESLLVRRRDELHDKGVRIRFAGRRDWRVPRRVLRRMDESIELTRGNTRMTLTMAFNYGGRAEIVDAVRRIVADGVPANKIDEREIRRHLYFPDMPDPDLVIRTSGEYRISNFLLWEIAYSELAFPDVLWPDVRRSHLYDAVVDFQRRNRRYGGVHG